MAKKLKCFVYYQQAFPYTVEMRINFKVDYNFLNCLPCFAAAASVATAVQENVSILFVWGSSNWRRASLTGDVPQTEVVKSSVEHALVNTMDDFPWKNAFCCFAKSNFRLPGAYTLLDFLTELHVLSLQQLLGRTGRLEGFMT